MILWKELLISTGMTNSENKHLTLPYPATALSANLQYAASSSLGWLLLHWPRLVESDHVSGVFCLVISFQYLHRLAVQSQTVPQQHPTILVSLEETENKYN